MHVALTNAIFTGLTLVLILLTATVFNQTLSENKDDIERLASRIARPLERALSWPAAVLGLLLGRSPRARDLGWLGAVAAVTVLVYGFLEPGFGLNQESLIVVLGLLVSAVAITYLTEGGETYLARTRWKQSAGVRIFPVAVLIAAVSVAVSRLGDFQPGVIYGFVGTAVFLRPSTMSEGQQAKMVLLPSVALLALSVTLWLAVTPLRDDGSSTLAAFVEGVCIAIFVSGIEGLFFNMIPVSFMDGEKLLRWNKAVWLAMAGCVTFVFWHVLLNDQRSYFDALKETTPVLALALGGFCLGLTLLTWLVFRLRASSRELRAPEVP
jgi:hypothetical protein